RHTIFSRDWSSDVCSSDLNQVTILCPTPVRTRRSSGAGNRLTTVELLTRKQALDRETKCLGDLRERRPEGTKLIAHIHLPRLNRTEERRVGIEHRARRRTE